MFRQSQTYFQNSRQLNQNKSRRDGPSTARDFLTVLRIKFKIKERSFPKQEEDEVKTQLRNFGIDPREFDFNDVNGFATAKKKLRQVGNEFTLIERIKKYEKSVAETPNNHCDGAKLFKNCQTKLINCEDEFDMDQEKFVYKKLLLILYEFL